MTENRRYKVMNYEGHVIYCTKTIYGDIHYGYAKHKDGTDVWFNTIEECEEDILRLESK